MKIQKSILKNLIKECLVEILVEGLDSSSSSPLKESLTRKPMTQQRVRSQQINQTQVQQKSLAAGITNDPILQEMLEHTATTTYGEQVSAEMPSLDALRLAEHSVADVSNVSVEQTPQNALWNALAFAPSKSKLH
jgi:hypothetical protein